MNDIDKLFDKLVNGIDLSRAVEKGCLVIENSAKQKCPVDNGNLRMSITHETEKNIGAVGTNTEYAP